MHRAESRRDDVRARLVESDERNAAAARAAEAAEVSGGEVVVGDASLTDHYAGMAPADLVLLCGVLGNVTDADVERTIDHRTRPCGPGVRRRDSPTRR